MPTRRQAIIWSNDDYFTDVYASLSLNDLIYIPWIQFELCRVIFCFSVTLFYPYPSRLLQWHWGNLMIALVAVEQPWRIQVNTAHELGTFNGSPLHIKDIPIMLIIHILLWLITINLLHKSHTAPVPYPTMHHFVTICVHIFVTKWCIVEYLSDASWDLWDSS